MKHAVSYTMILAQVFAACVAGSDVPGSKDRYQLIKGAGIEVCEVYGRNLNMTQQYPACQREIVLPMFGRPEWERVDALEYIGLVRKIDGFLRTEHKPIDEQGYVEYLKARVKRGSISLSITQADINNDGDLETIAKYEDGRCHLHRFYAAPLVVLKAKGSGVDVTKTELLLQNRARTKEHIMGRWGYAMYDVFLYQGKAYFDRWSDDAKERGYLRVFQAEKHRTIEICVYRYD